MALQVVPVCDHSAENGQPDRCVRPYQGVRTGSRCPQERGSCIEADTLDHRARISVADLRLDGDGSALFEAYSRSDC